MPTQPLRARRQAARPRARHRPDRLGQVDDARVAARPRQPHAARAHPHDRGSDRVPPLAPHAASSTSARSAPTRPSFAEALRAALRQDPDVILVGEMRDLETIGTALTAAETGHLVFATLHTQSAPQTIDRIIDVFPAEQQDQVRVQLAGDAAGRRHAEPRADRRRPRPRRRARDPDPGRRRPEPDPPGEDRADLLGHADEHRARHADDGAVARRPRAAPGDHARGRASPARRGPTSCAACSSAPASTDFASAESSADATASGRARLAGGLEHGGPEEGDQALRPRSSGRRSAKPGAATSRLASRRSAKRRRSRSSSGSRSAPRRSPPRAS